jgi:hypothetical protein
MSVGQAKQRRVVLPALVVAVAFAASCGSRMLKQYEYEEDVHLSLDGSAVVYLNASVPALVALRGLDLDVAPNARLDRARVRAMYTSPASEVTRVSTSRRLGRRFVHVRLVVDDIRRLGEAGPFAWSAYQFQPGAGGGQLIYRQVVGASAGRDVGQVGWTGRELVAFRLHVPSRIDYHNAGPDNLERGNILVWERTLDARRAGDPLEMEVRMQTTSILARTLLLFAASGAAGVPLRAQGKGSRVGAGGRAGRP